MRVEKRTWVPLSLTLPLALLLSRLSEHAVYGRDVPGPSLRRQALLLPFPHLTLFRGTLISEP